MKWSNYHMTASVSYNPALFNSKNFIKIVILGAVTVEAVRVIKLLAGAAVARVVKKYAGDKEIEVNADNTDNNDDADSVDL